MPAGSGSQTSYGKVKLRAILPDKVYELQIVDIKQSFCKTKKETHLHITVAPNGEQGRRIKVKNKQEIGLGGVKALKAMLKICSISKGNPISVDWGPGTSI